MSSPSEPDQDTAWRLGDSVADVVASFRDFLLVRFPTHLRHFDLRLQADSEAAQAEVVIFSLLRQLRLKPEIAEVVGQGGVDFRALPSTESEFIVEVTTIGSATVTQKSGVPNGIADGAFAFDLITTTLKGKSAAKAAQMSNYTVPGLLVIASLHDGARLVLYTFAAERLLVSDTVMSVPIGVEDGPVREVAKLHNSVFFRLDSKSGQVVPCRRSNSAILLAAISDESTYLTGLLHPAAAHPFTRPPIPGIPFVRVEHWRISDGRISTEWVIARPEASVRYHATTRLSDAELRGL